MRAKANKTTKSGYFHSPEIAMALQQAYRYWQAGQTDMANSLCQSILETSPRHPRALNLLGIIEAESGRQAAAATLLRRAIKSNPDDPVTYHNLAKVYLDQDKLNDAVRYARKALALKPDYAEALTNLGLALQNSGHYEKALNCFEQATAIKPDFAEAMVNKANILKYLGHYSEAIKNYQHALQLQPEFYQTHIALAYCKRFSEYDEDVRAMESALSAPDIQLDKEIKLNFALAKVYEDLQGYDRSFSHAKTGNRLKRSSFSYDISNEEKIVEDMTRIFTRDLFERHRQHGSPRQGPIFVLGMPRSGTTLIEQILASHPDVYGAGEIFEFHGALNRFGLDINQTDFTRRIADIDGDKLAKIGNDYIKRVKKLAGSEKYICDKLPHNFLLLGLISLALPKARIIHCVRDPLDTCLSCYMMLFATGQQFSYNLEELERFYRLYRRLMNHMRSVIPDAFLDLQYEDLVNNQEEETRKLLDYCGLEWNEACLNFQHTRRIVTTASDSQVRRPMYHSSIKRWKRFEKYLQPLKDAINYPA